MVERLVVVSPHLDDAALSCGNLLAARPGSIVVTLFGGSPQRGRGLTGWDTDCRLDGRYEDGAAVMAARREEDARALDVLGAVSVSLNFSPHAYRRLPPALPPYPEEELVDALREALAAHASQAALVCIPLGLQPEHIVASEACLKAIAGSRAVIAYEELAYRILAPHLVTRRIAELRRHGFEVREAPELAAVPTPAKWTAIQGYATQLPALMKHFPPGWHERPMIDDEVFWHVGTVR